ncbi:hypothetical protein PRUB_b0330 [Pseudoalteromonas rubra]|uniref:Uncharacterized protein n=1 Tax=Pseudoalteromonas rubra TaxID=43658 RepID=A0A8T0BZH0_9GAMM|nr:hypothetical protein PRUB_b0330 [Pseudoalteromonas rubra]
MLRKTLNIQASTNQRINYITDRVVQDQSSGFSALSAFCMITRQKKKQDNKGHYLFTLSAL